MTKLTNLTHDRLTEVLGYDPETGVFAWKISSSNSVKVGSRAGAFHKPSGARYLNIDGEKFMAHRVAWFYVHGEWSVADIRPVNGDYDDCRIANLVEIERSQLAHMRAAPKTNKSGFIGVSQVREGGKWQAAITWNYRQIPLGANFDTPEEASEIYQLAVGRLRDAQTDADRDAIVADLRLFRRQRAAWKNLQRWSVSMTWATFEEFAADIRDIPTSRYAMAPVDAGFPIGPGNFRWALPIDAQHNSSTDRKGYARANRKHNVELNRAKHIKKEYGADIAYERKLLVEQKGLCAICEKPEELSRGSELRRLSLDHDHKTRALRGLLCGNCNLGVGYFCDDPEIMRKAIAYLGRYADQAPNVVPFKTGDSS